MSHVQKFYITTLLCHYVYKNNSDTILLNDLSSVSTLLQIRGQQSIDSCLTILDRIYLFRLDKQNSISFRRHCRS